jgi:hypothetical protein
MSNKEPQNHEVITSTFDILRFKKNSFNPILALPLCQMGAKVNP